MGQLSLGLPFAGILLSFALLPAFAPRFWHRRMGTVIGAWVALGCVQQAGAIGAGPALRALAQTSLGEFLPFIALLLALYALGGGIGISGGPWGRPAGNLLILVCGTLLASVMGTTGAALLLIHPLLAGNGHRRETRHLVLGFIILVGNCGGALSPLGDPPLLIGFLRGVPFFWPTAHLWRPLLVLAVPVLALVFALDVALARGEPPPPPRKRLRVRGGLNIFLLLVLMLAVPVEGVWHPGVIRLFGLKLPGGQLAVTLLAALCIGISERFTARAIRAHNRFAWATMREIVILFFAIFATIGPVFVLLEQARLPQQPGLWFWASGIASAVLDAAPTYLIFFQAAGGDAARLTAGSGHLLAALSAGSVFFGPVTYLGNAPNLMIRAIASRRGVRMPGFFTYAAVMTVVLTPIYLAMTWLFY
jgi:Na+/H+ antiporter NhaD/arsenite permease-like protein